jgi:hypothetical protein
LLDGCSTTFSVLGGDATPIALLDDCATTNAVLGGGSTPIALHDDCATTNAVLGGGSTPIALLDDCAFSSSPSKAISEDHINKNKNIDALLIRVLSHRRKKSIIS